MVLAIMPPSPDLHRHTVVWQRGWMICRWRSPSTLHRRYWKMGATSLLLVCRSSDYALRYLWLCGSIWFHLHPTPPPPEILDASATHFVCTCTRRRKTSSSYGEGEGDAENEMFVNWNNAPQQSSIGSIVVSSRLGCALYCIIRT